MIYARPMDCFFDYKFSKLPYRSLRFEWDNFDMEKFQDVAQVKYRDNEEKFPRIIEHKFLIGQINKNSVISKEFPQMKGEPFYPIPNSENSLLFDKYKAEANELKSVKFVGRLAEYKYYNMDQVVGRLLKKYGK